MGALFQQIGTRHLAEPPPSVVGAHGVAPAGRGAVFTGGNIDDPAERSGVQQFLDLAVQRGIAQNESRVDGDLCGLFGGDDSLAVLERGGQRLFREDLFPGRQSRQDRLAVQRVGGEIMTRSASGWFTAASMEAEFSGRVRSNFFAKSWRDSGFGS